MDFSGGDEALRQHLIVAGLTHNPHAINAVCGPGTAYIPVHCGCNRHPIAHCIREDFYRGQRHLRLQVQFAAVADAMYELGAALDALMPYIEGTRGG
jgi:hypothetical protein